MSAVTHAALFLSILFITSRMPDPAMSRRVTSVAPESIIWIPQLVRGGGGGGGGDGAPEPPRRAEAPGLERLTVRPAPAAAMEPQPQTTNLDPAVDMPALPMAAGLAEMPGEIAALPTASISLGPGSRGGAGRGRFGGDGPGEGPGYGPGQDRGVGGGPHGPESGGVTFPRLIREVAPTYTNGALQARVQGFVELRAVVHADGTVGDVWITRSLDRTFGIDDEAVRTIKLWRFAPATRNGRPITIVVPIELRFTIR